MKYRLLALDIDGTCLGPDQQPWPDLADALTRAQRAGLKVCLATGRSLVESLPVWRVLPFAQPCLPMVLVGGALVSEPETGRTLAQWTIAPELLDAYAEVLLAEGRSVLATLDAWRSGYDYHVAVGDDYDDVCTRWFGQMAVQVRTCGRFGEVEAMPRAIRLNSLVSRDEGERLMARLQPLFGDRLNLHVIHAPNYDVTVLEAFSRKADKATGVGYIAQGLAIPMAQVVAVGDDVNDLAMIRRAGLGVAMANAKQFVKDAADCVAEQGLARFIHDLLDGNCPDGKASKKALQDQST